MRLACVAFFLLLFQANSWGNSLLGILLCDSGTSVPLPKATPRIPNNDFPMSPHIYIYDPTLGTYSERPTWGPRIDDPASSSASDDPLAEVHSSPYPVESPVSSGLAFSDEPIRELDDIAAIQVLIATNRARNRDPNARPHERFVNTSISSGLDYARCIVFLPKKANYWELPKDDGPEYDPMRHFRFGQFASLGSQEAFLNSITRRPFIFVHGYNVDFDDSVYRTAQLAYDLYHQLKEDSIDDPRITPVCYTWSSRGDILRYINDRDASFKASIEFQPLLRDICLRASTRKLNLPIIISHSTGGSLVSSALRISENNPPRLAEEALYIYAAPDVAVEDFYFGPYGKDPNRSCLVLTNRYDPALFASSMVRVNDSIMGAHATCNDAYYLVDVCRVQPVWAGHFYYGDSSEVLQLITGFLVRGSEAFRANSALEQVDQQNAGCLQWIYKW